MEHGCPTNGDPCPICALIAELRVCRAGRLDSLGRTRMEERVYWVEKLDEMRARAQRAEAEVARLSAFIVDWNVL